MKRLALFTLLLCSCAASAAPRGPATEMDKMAAKELSDPAKPVTAAVGADFTLTLASNATTGYQWQLAQAPDEKVARFAGKQYLAPKTRAMGAGGVEVWTFRAVGKGNTGISLKYVRPWEKDVPPVREAVFQVIVK